MLQKAVKHMLKSSLQKVGEAAATKLAPNEAESLESQMLVSH